MAAAKVAISLDARMLARLDRLVRQQVFPNRSKAIEEAVKEKLERLDQVAARPGVRQARPEAFENARSPKRGCRGRWSNGPNTKRRHLWGDLVSCPEAGSRPAGDRFWC